MSTQKYVNLNGLLYQRVEETSRRVVAAIWEPSKGDSDITAEKLVDSFPELDENVAAELAAAAGGVHAGVYNDFLRAADKAIDAHGVEPLALGPDGQNKYGLAYEDRKIAYYVNTGDTFSATLLYDPEDEKVYLTTWGDWLQAWERVKEKEMGSEEDV